MDRHIIECRLMVLETELEEHQKYQRHLQSLSWLQRRFGTNWLGDAFMIVGLCLAGFVLFVGFVFALIVSFDTPSVSIAPTTIIIFLLICVLVKLDSKK